MSNNDGMHLMSTLLEATEERMKEMTVELDHYKSCYEAFFTGNVGRLATLDHMVLAQWGRKRKEAMKQTPVLLGGNVNN